MIKTTVHYQDGRTHTMHHHYEAVAHLYGNLMCEYRDVLMVTYEQEG